jgi:hypothetical protein
MEAVVKIARTQIANLNAPLKKIRAKRNRVLAHVDQAIVRDPAKLARQVELTFSDLNLVLNTGGSILNELSVKLRDSSPLYDMIGADDYQSAIHLITDAKCAHIRNYEAEFGLLWDGPRPKKCPNT